MDIKQEIEKQRKWVEIGKATVEQVIEEGQPQEIIDYERENLKKDEAILEQLLKEAENEPRQRLLHRSYLRRVPC